MEKQKQLLKAHWQRLHEHFRVGYWSRGIILVNLLNREVTII